MPEKDIKKYTFYRTKYGRELLIDFGRIESLKNYNLTDQPHYLTFYDIMFIRKGKGIFRLDEQEYEVAPNRIVFSSPGQVRQWLVSGSVNAYVLFFEAEFINRFFNDARFVRKFQFFDNPELRTDLEVSKKDFQKLETFLIQIENEINAFKDYSEDMLRAVLYQILVFLNRLYNTFQGIEHSGKKSVHVNRFVNLIEENFSEMHRVKDYAVKLNVTPNHINYLSKKHMNCSAKQLICNRIILEAKRLLLYSDLSISEIGYKLAFEDPSYFVRFFKKNTGITPSVYRSK
ncbi:AraC family transcriptional regulator [candidate division KSB1 bacterium]